MVSHIDFSHVLDRTLESSRFILKLFAAAAAAAAQ